MLKIEHLGKTYGSGDKAVKAIADLDFEVNEKELVCVVGPSGCGKTTLLKCMSGLLPATTGQVLLHGEQDRGAAREHGAGLPGVQPLAVPVDDRAPERVVPAQPAARTPRRRSSRRSSPWA